MRLKDRTAVITGGASGMGLATVYRFLEEGASVVIADFNEETGKAAIEDMTRLGYESRASFIRTDVANEDDIAAMCHEATDRFGSLDILFNNAGVGGAIGPLTETTAEDWDYTFDVLARGVFLGIKHGARIMTAQGRGGSIMNTASVAAGVFRRNGGSNQPVEIGCRGAGAGQDQGQCDLPWFYRHAARRCRGCGFGERRICPVPALAGLRSGGTHCRRGPVPGIGRFRVCDRRSRCR